MELVSLIILVLLLVCMAYLFLQYLLKESGLKDRLLLRNLFGSGESQTPSTPESSDEAPLEAVQSIEPIESNEIATPSPEEGQKGYFVGTKIANESVKEGLREWVVLTILANKAQDTFSYEAISEACIKHGLSFDDEAVFVGKVEGSPAFRIVNAVKPGNFSLKNSHHKTPGIAAFMDVRSLAREGASLPLVFDNLLDAVKRVAYTLEARLCNERRVLLTAKEINRIKSELLIAG